MAVVKNLMVRAGADFSAITTQANKAKSSMSGMEATVSKSFSKMTASVRSMGKVFAALGATISAAAIVSFAKEAKSAYDKQAEGEAKLAQVMKNTIGASQAEINSIKELLSAQQALGVIGDEVQVAGAQELATYVSMTSTLQRLIPVMNDMVAQQYGYNATAENATNIATMLGKVLSGQTSALSRYGYTFTAAQEAVLKYGSEAQRAATLAEVVEQSVGGMNAALAATPTGRLKQVSNTLGDIKESFGLAVTSIATTFLPVLNSVCTVLANMATLANKVAQAIANVFGGGASAAATAVTYTAGASAAMDDLAGSTKAAANAAKKLGTYGFDTLQKMGSASSSSSGGGETAEGSSGGGTISESTKGAEEAAESVGWLEKGLARLKETVDKIDFGKVSDALDRFKTSVEPLTSTLFAGLKWAYDNVLEPLAQWTIEDAIPAFLDTLGSSAQAIAGPLQSLGTAVQPLVSTAFDGLKWAYDNVFIPFAGWAGGSLAPAFLDTLAAGARVLSAAISVLQPVGTWLWDNFLAPIATWTGGAIVTTLETIAGLFNLHADVISGNISIWDALGKAANLVVSGILTVLRPIAEWVDTNVLEPVKNAWNGAMSKLKEWASDAWTGIQNVWIAASSWFTTNIAEPVKDAWNGATSKLKEWASDAWTGIQNVWIVASSWFTTNIAEPVKNAWSGAMTNLSAWGSNAWTNIKSAWNAASAWFSENVSGPIGSAWSTATTNLKEWGSNAWTNIKDVWSVASSWFTTNVTTPITNGFKGFANGIIGFFEGLVNGAISGINTIVRALNKISFDVPEWVPVIGGGKFGFNLSTVETKSLPRLAEGAVFPGGHPYAAIVNDQKHGVNVETPLATMIEAMMTALRSTDFGSDIQVNVRAVFDGQLAALARLLRPYFEADAQRVGQQASTAKGVL